MTNKKLLEQSIADANALRTLALETAKQDLIESFQPHIKSMISRVIENDEDLDQLDIEDEDEIIEGDDDEETLNQEDDYDNEEIINLDNEVAEGEKDESLDSDTTSDEVTDENDDEEIDLDIEDDEVIDENDDEEIDLDIEDDEETDLADEDLNETDQDPELDINLDDLNDKKDEELDEAYKTIKLLKKRINEVNLLNYKLFCSNKIFNRFSLNRKQKVKIIESMDRAKNVNEAKLIYQILFKNLNTISPAEGKNNTTRLRESVSRIKTSTTKVKNPIITEENADALSRRQVLAGIRRKN